jgi:hypothetical protein
LWASKIRAEEQDAVERAEKAEAALVEAKAEIERLHAMMGKRRGGERPVHGALPGGGRWEEPRCERAGVVASAGLGAVVRDGSVGVLRLGGVGAVEWTRVHASTERSVALWDDCGVVWVAVGGMEKEVAVLRAGGVVSRAKRASQAALMSAKASSRRRSSTPVRRPGTRLRHCNCPTSSTWS